MELKKLITITGPSYSGKSCFEDFLNKNGISKVKSTTTRPKRSTEKETDYYFVSYEEFCRKVNENKMVEYCLINNYFYGVSTKELKEKFKYSDTICVVIDPNGKKSLERYCEDNNIEIHRIFIKRSPFYCLAGLLKRIFSGEVTFFVGMSRIKNYVFDEFWWRRHSYDEVLKNNSNARSNYLKSLETLT